jgi:excisionase family DNA binding protein
VQLLKPNDVAQQLAVSRSWVYEAARTGRIPSIRIGGEDGPLRFIPEDIERWLVEARDRWTPARTRPQPARPAIDPPHIRPGRRQANGQQSLLD